MTRLSIISVAAFAMLAGCSQKTTTQAASEPSNPASAAPVDEFCAHGGMEAARDPRCKAAADQRFRKFMKGGGGDEHGRR